MFKKGDRVIITPEYDTARMLCTKSDTVRRLVGKVVTVSCIAERMQSDGHFYIKVDDNDNWICETVVKPVVGDYIAPLF